LLTALGLDYNPSFLVLGEDTCIAANKHAVSLSHKAIGIIHPSQDIPRMSFQTMMRYIAGTPKFVVSLASLTMSVCGP
jgi:hypothetical protein